MALTRGGGATDLDTVVEVAEGDDARAAYAFTPNTVELITTLGSLCLRGGPVQDLVLIEGGSGPLHTGEGGYGPEHGSRRSRGE